MNLNECACGGTAVLHEIDNRDFWVRCNTCPRESEHKTSPTKAASAWNSLIAKVSAEYGAILSSAAPTIGADALKIERERVLFEVANRHRPLEREDYAHPDPEVHHRYYDTATQSAWEGWQDCASSRDKTPATPFCPPDVDPAELAEALADPDQVPYLIVFDDHDRPNESLRGRKRARLRYKQISGGWNAHLFVKIDSNSKDCRQPSDSDLRLQAGIDEDIARYAFEGGLGSAQVARDAADPQREIASLRIECARLSRGWSDAATRLAHMQNEAGAEAPKNAARIEHLEQWLRQSQRRGFKWNAYSFETDATVAQQLDAKIKQTAGSRTASAPAPIGKGSGG
jgi:hypothetical protein